MSFAIVFAAFFGGMACLFDHVPDDIFTPLSTSNLWRVFFLILLVAAFIVAFGFFTLATCSQVAAPGDVRAFELRLDERLRPGFRAAVAAVSAHQGFITHSQADLARHLAFMPGYNQR